jgi:hypothetical protein
MHDLPFMTYCVNNGYRRDKRTTYDAPSCNPTNRVMMIPDRAALVRRGMLLNYATLGYNALEAVIAVVAGVLAGSIALVGFGLDSVVEVIASVAAQWRLRADLDELRRVRTEWIARRIIGWSFLALSVIALAGVGLNTFFGWWWADPVAALGMVPIIATEGVEGVRVARLS